MYFCVENGKPILRSDGENQVKIELTHLTEGKSPDKIFDMLMSVIKNSDKIPLDYFYFNDKRIEKGNVSDEFIEEFSKQINRSIEQEIPFSSGEYIYLKGKLSKTCIGKPIFGIGGGLEPIADDEEIYFYNISGFYTIPKTVESSILIDCNIEFSDFHKILQRIIGNSCVVTFGDLVRLNYGVLNVVCIPCDKIDGFDPVLNESILKIILKQI